MEKRKETSILIRNYNENVEGFVCERETLEIMHMLQADEQTSSGIHPENETVLLNETDIHAQPPSFQTKGGG